MKEWDFKYNNIFISDLLFADDQVLVAQDNESADCSSEGFRIKPCSSELKCFIEPVSTNKYYNSRP